MTRHAPQRQRGVALITVILIVAIATIASVGMLSSDRLAVHRTALLLQSETGWWYIEGVEQWVMTILQRDAEENQVDSLDEPWAMPVDYLPVDDGVLRGRITDLQGRFNLNNLGDPDPTRATRYREQFVRLFRLVEAGDHFQANALAAVIRDWIDTDQEPTGFDGAEDNEYLGYSPPYRSADQPLQSITELLVMKGMKPEIYRALAPHVAALPEYGTPVNVNTATEAVLLSLVEEPGPELMQFLESREERPLSDAGELAKLFGPQAPPQDIRTRYFRLESEALIGSTRVGLYHFIFRPGQGSPILLGRSSDID